jgi:hypothetical protein
MGALNFTFLSALTGLQCECLTAQPASGSELPVSSHTSTQFYVYTNNLLIALSRSLFCVKYAPISLTGHSVMCICSYQGECPCYADILRSRLLRCVCCESLSYLVMLLASALYIVSDGKMTDNEFGKMWNKVGMVWLRPCRGICRKETSKHSDPPCHLQCNVSSNLHISCYIT